MSQAFKETEIGLLPAESNAETQRGRDAEKGNALASQRLSDSALKETQIGLIRVEWRVKKLEEICRLKRGGVDSTDISPPSPRSTNAWKSRRR